MQTCRERGMKATHQRIEIFRELAASGAHPDAETVYQAVSQRVPSISRDTVYRTLATLEAEGFVRKINPLFERARYDANLDHHHHFICTVCGSVTDFCSERLDNLPIPASVEALGEIDSAHVQVQGICAACAHNRKPTQPPAGVL